MIEILNIYIKKYNSTQKSKFMRKKCPYNISKNNKRLILIGEYTFYTIPVKQLRFSPIVNNHEKRRFVLTPL